MITQRWTLADVATSEVWTMPINPDSMSSPIRRRNLRYALGGRQDRRLRAMRVAAPAEDWEWSGVIRTQAHYDALLAWAKKPGAIDVTDHLGRTFRVVITDFVPTDRKPTRRTTWRLRYTMKTKLLEEIA